MNKSQSSIVKELAIKWHDGQFRFDGKTPFVTHPISVMESMAELGYGDLHQAVAVGHDLFEDTAITEKDFKDAGVVKIVIDGIKDLTHLMGESYDDFILRVKTSPFVAVKVHDIIHNGFDKPSNKQKQKYAKALRVLFKR